MVDFLASSIKVFERDPSIVTFPELLTAVPGFVGLTEFGPVDIPTECFSWDEYVENFGRFYKTDNAETAMVPLAAWCFFLNGGSKCNITRRQTGTPVKATVSLDDRDTTPVATLQIDALWLGAYGNNLAVTIEAASNAELDQFNMTILRNGVIVEVWPNLSMTDADANHVEAVVNHEVTGSQWVLATNLDSTSTPPDDLPALQTATSLASGADGDAIDAASIDGGDNFADLESADITLLACPDLSSDALHETMITYCETTRDSTVLAVLDPVAAADSSAINTAVAALTVSNIWVMYWPRVRIPNPDTTVFSTEGELVVVPPSGVVCGLMARIDGQNLSGPFTQPAGVDNGRVLGVVDLESDNHEVIHESARDKVFPNRVNPITWMRGYGIFVDGARTGSAAGNFPSVGERRGMSHINRVLATGLQWVRHKNNTEGLRSKIQRSVYAEMLNWTSNEAFASMDPDEAFVVNADVPGVGINNARVRAQKKVYLQVGAATAEPAEYVIILVSKDMRAYQETLKGLV